MNKDISITALATDKEIDQLWHIAWEILDRNKLDDDINASFKFSSKL